MALDLFRNIVMQASEIALEVNFSFFGEPMMHPEFIKFMDYLKDRTPELRVVMNTNFSLATTEIIGKLIEIRLDELRVSLDAASSSIYSQVRPGSNCLDLSGKPTDGDRFNLICQKLNHWFSLPKHCPTRHVFTVNSLNVREMKAFASRWLPLLGSNDEILFKSVLSYGGKIYDERIYPNRCDVWNLNTLTVDWAGNVSPCNLDTNMDLKIGSVQENSLKELFYSKKMQEVKKMSQQKKHTACKKCIDANNWSRNFILRRGEKWPVNLPELCN